VRYLFIAFDFKPSLGGVADYTHNLAYHLQQSGEDVTIVAPLTTTPDSARFDKEQPYRVIRYSLEDYGKSVFHRHLFMAKLLDKTIREIKPACIIFNVWTPYTTTMQILCSFRKKPHFLIAHGMEINSKNLSFKNRLWRNISFRKSSYLIVNSNYTKTLCEKMGIRDDRIFILNPGIDTAIFHIDTQKDEIRKSLDIPQDDKVLLSIGRLIERKGFDRAIEAVAMLRKTENNFLYILIGDGPERHTLESLIKKLNLEDNVLLKGNVSDREKMRYLNSADIFLMPNRELPNGDVEGFGIVFLEANMCGVPVIAGKSGGTVDAVEHGKTGLLIDGTNVQEIFHALRELMANSQLRRDMGKKGKARVERDFAWAKIAARFQDITHALLETH